MIFPRLLLLYTQDPSAVYVYVQMLRGGWAWHAHIIMYVGTAL